VFEKSTSRTRFIIIRIYFFNQLTFTDISTSECDIHDADDTQYLQDFNLSRRGFMKTIDLVLQTGSTIRPEVITMHAIKTIQNSRA